jgi:hypothetical protein
MAHMEQLSWRSFFDSPAAPPEAIVIQFTVIKSVNS